MVAIQGAGGGGSTGCFTGDTLVSVPGGAKRLKILLLATLFAVLTTGLVHNAEVLKVHEHPDNRVVRYTFWGGEYLDVTPSHWY